MISGVIPSKDIINDIPPVLDSKIEVQSANENFPDATDQNDRVEDVGEDPIADGIRSENTESVNVEPTPGPSGQSNPGFVNVEPTPGSSSGHSNPGPLDSFDSSTVNLLLHKVNVLEIKDRTNQKVIAAQHESVQFLREKVKTLTGDKNNLRQKLNREQKKKGKNGLFLNTYSLFR